MSNKQTPSRTLWILPHRSQTGETEVIEQGTLKRLTDVIQVTHLPKEIVIGIPESLLRNHAEEDFLFSQFHRKGYEGYDIFLISLKCGTDKEGRIVFLTMLRILAPSDDPLGFQVEQSLPPEEVRFATRLLERFQKQDDLWIKSIKNMLKAIENYNNFASFANIPIPNCVYLPDWPVKKKLLRAFVIFLLIILIVILIFSSTANTTNTHQDECSPKYKNSNNKQDSFLYNNSFLNRFIST
jgi:hypothetical protein